MAGKSKPITAFGVTYPSISALCRAHNCTSTTFRQRVEVEGMSPEDAIKTPPRRNPKRPGPRIKGVQYASVSEALERFGVSRDLYQERRVVGWEIITACFTPSAAGSLKENEPIYARGSIWATLKEVRRAHNVDLETYNLRVQHEWPRSRACCLPEIITNARVPMMFPDELRRVLNTYTCESHLEDGCTIWPGNLAKSGFIEVYAMRKRYSVPRLVYCMEHDVHPNDLSSRVSVSPACGNVRCIKPEHMLAVLNRRRNNWKGARPDDQPDQAVVDSSITVLPPEVIAEAQKLLNTSWCDLGMVANILGTDVHQLKAGLGIK